MMDMQHMCTVFKGNLLNLKNHVVSNPTCIKSIKINIFENTEITRQMCSS